jgi:RsiW-degrading membrane proteinase PrsW (M82 family)
MAAKFLIAPVIAFPVAGLLWYNSHQTETADRVPTSFLLNTWIVSGFVGPAVAGAAQFAIAWPGGKLVFGDQFDRYLLEIGRSENDIKKLDAEAVAFRRNMAFSFPALTASSFLTTLAPLTEEIFKYAALRIVERHFPERTRTKRNCVLVAMAVGLGFALVENLAFIAVANDKESQTQLAVTIIERGIFGTSGHFLTATLTGCKFADSRNYEGGKKSMWSIIKESLLYHALGNLSLFTISTLYGNPGWVHPRDPLGIFACLACLVGVNSVAAWRVNTEIARIDEKSKRKAA